MAKTNKLKAAAVKIGSAVGRAEGKAMKAATTLKKKAKAVGKELKETKKHLVRAYKEAKA